MIKERVYCRVYTGKMLMTKTSAPVSTKNNNENDDERWLVYKQQSKSTLNKVLL